MLISEIREDFAYAAIIEVAILIACVANALYSGEFDTALLYVLVFVGVLVLQGKIERGIIISRERNLKRKFEMILGEKRRSKRIAVSLLVLLILLSSWGIVSYLANFHRETREYAKVITMVVPWYVAIYTGWIIYLSYLKGRYTKLLVSLLEKKRNWKRVRYVLLLHGDKVIAQLSPEPRGEVERKKLVALAKRHGEDFRLASMNVLVSTLGSLKLVVAVTGDADSDLRVRMMDALKAIKIAYPRGFQTGEFKESDILEVENLLRRYLLA